MSQSTDIGNYTTIGFDSKKYFELQKNAILERISKFSGRLYLEIGGKFMVDQHASRVLPGFDPFVKKKIFESLANDAEMIFNINYDNLISNRQLSNQDIDYAQYTKTMVQDIIKGIGLKPYIVVNMCSPSMNTNERTIFEAFVSMMENLGLQVFKRYRLPGYPENLSHILSKEGFGGDEYVPVKKSLILVSGAASNSGKMSTCFGQIYGDKQQGLESGYAKYETFPIWNLPVEHPINLAYEAATVDIGDYNCVDTYYEKAYGKLAVNYNRDVEAFELLLHIGKQLFSEKNFTRTYKSPTDMGINFAGFGITDEKICCKASIEEIKRRKERYKEIIARGQGDKKWLKKCDEILEKAKVLYVL